MTHALPKKIAAAIVAFALILTGYYLYTTYPRLPESFIVHLTQDATSSGGSRYTEAILTYGHGELVRGTLTYTHSRETTTTTTCTYTQNAWLGDDETLCTISFISIPSTAKELRTLMRTEKIKPLGDGCTHYGVCYTFDTPTVLP